MIYIHDIYHGYISDIFGFKNIKYISKENNNFDSNITDQHYVNMKKLTFKIDDL